MQYIDEPIVKALGGGDAFAQGRIVCSKGLQACRELILNGIAHELQALKGLMRNIVQEWLGRGSQWNPGPNLARGLGLARGE